MNNRQSVVAMAAVLATAFSLVQKNACAQSPSPDMSGCWGGFVSSETPDRPNFISTMNYQLQLQGTPSGSSSALFPHYSLFAHFDSAAGASEVAIEGTAEISGIAEIGGQDLIVNLKGSSSDGSRFKAHGTIHFVDQNPFIAVRYDRIVARQSSSTGTIMHELGHTIACHHGGACNDTPGSNVTATWTGTFLRPNNPSAGQYSMLLTNGLAATGAEPSAGLTGSARFVSADGTFDGSFDLQGTVGVPAVQLDGSLASPFAAVGVNSGPVGNGQIAIVTGLLHPGQQDLNGGTSPPTITGRYSLYNSMSDVFADFEMNESTAFDTGTFSVNPKEDPGV